MINVSNLQKGSVIVALVDYPGMGLKKGEHLKVKDVGWSKWDRMHYADCITPKGYEMEIMKSYLDFDLVML